MRLLKLIAFLVVAALIALVGYAYFGDMAADSRQMRVPVELDLDLPAAAPAAAATPAPAAPASDTPDEPSDPDALD